ncbi:putative pentatricopeptide repeat-containing protein At3g49142 [Coffea eugenioides]|uniref:putative pentatricopeptide repeat-containing protein At3g49142 n=1 Tax=Coffea eugenioides TaxID=49369 RepID=UPI000F6085C0|nr:putative pentatricopeptide repeat-containing protein At3g49142 [Coffea eugenioides]
MKSIPLHVSRQFSTACQKALLLPTATVPSEAASYSQVLDKWPDIRTLKKIHSRIILHLNLSSCISFGIKLMRAYAARGQTSITRQIFDRIPERNVVIFNVMIRSYVNNHLYHDALFMFKSMNSSNTNPDYYTFPCILKACSASMDLRVGLQVHTQVLKMNLDGNLYVGNGLIAMYGKCGSLTGARSVLDEMPRRDVVSWNSMVVGYAQNGAFNDALEVCREMQTFGLNPDAGTLASLLPAVTNTSSENVAFVEDMFMKVRRDELVPWNVMIAIYVNNSMPNKAVELYMEMEESGIEPDAITISSILPACGDLSAIMMGQRIHKYVERKRIWPNLSVENALIDMYAKCGCLQEAKEVFDKMHLRDVVSWTSVISAYGKSGKGAKVVALFSEMQESITPDAIAFVSILSACSHAGLLEEGRHFYELMTKEYKIVPRLEHFACMVDLLGRAGRVREAYDFIKQMPLEPNETVWGAFLSACHVHKDMDIALEAADHLFQLAPKVSGYYVLLSNIYAKSGRWKEVASIRSIMKCRGIKKLPGISNVELNNQVHTFLAGDQSHPQSTEIYEELDALIGKMKDAGYVPETEDALHDVEDEDKENHLVVHSEKLAIVFAMINTKPGTLIRITKNLRVCRDCHIAAKLISKITERQIIIRDANRFHHFENGFCSCGDYW